MFRLGLSSLLLASWMLNATEVDSFTDRDPSIKDSTDVMNDMMYQYFKYAVEQANEQESCDSSVIEKAMATKDGNLFWSVIEIDIERSTNIDKRRSQVSKSVFQDMSWWDAPVLHLASLGYMMRVGGLYVGSDKFGHFIQQGHEYFKMVEHKGKTLGQALAWGDLTERTYLGLTMTGIYSYGDLVANYEGMLFWQRVTGKGLRSDIEPYFACESNKWIINAPFDWREYINEAWDEAINCNRYGSSSVEEQINERIHALGHERQEMFRCPLQPDKCEVMKARYPDVGYSVLSPVCR